MNAWGYPREDTLPKSPRVEAGYHRLCTDEANENEKRQQQRHSRATGPPEVWMTINAGVEAGCGIDDGKSKRLDCSANIDVANSARGPSLGSSKATSYTNESFKASARRKANSNSSQTPEERDECSFFPSCEAGS